MLVAETLEAASYVLVGLDMREMEEYAQVSPRIHIYYFFKGDIVFGECRYIPLGEY